MYFISTASRKHKPKSMNTIILQFGVMGVSVCAIRTSEIRAIHSQAFFKARGMILF